MNDLDDVPLKQNPRLRLLVIPPLLAAGVLIAALAWRQFGKGAELREIEQFQSHRLIMTPGSRGVITDRNGTVLVDNLPRYGVALDLSTLRKEFRKSYVGLRDALPKGAPFKSGELESEARKKVVDGYLNELSSLVGRYYSLTSQQIDRHLFSNRLLPLPVARDLSETEYARLMESLPVDSPLVPHLTVARTYPFARTASHVLGRVAEHRVSKSVVVRPENIAPILKLEAVRTQERRVREGEPLMTAADALAEAAPGVLQQICDRLGSILGRTYLVDPEAVRDYYEGQTGPAAGPYLRPVPGAGAPLHLITELSELDVGRLRDAITKSDRGVLDLPIEFCDSLKRFPRAGSPNQAPEGLAREAARPLETGKSLITFRQRGLLGQDGVELSFDEELSGDDGREVWLVDPSGTRQQLVEKTAPTRGHDVSLSLDLPIQQATEEALGTGYGAAVMVDVATGEVLAMASRPDFDLNLFSLGISNEAYDELKERDAFLNLALNGFYPPASTFKIVTAVAGFNSGVIETMGENVCLGHVTIGGNVFHCHERYSGHSDPPDYRPLGFEQGFMVSCNPYFFKVGLLVGVDRLSAAARMFGLHERTLIELPFEAKRMVVPDPAWKRKTAGARGLPLGWFDGDTANMSIGQGDLLVTPLQMGALIASVARGETRTKLTIRKLPPGAKVAHGGMPLPLKPNQLQRLRDGFNLVTTGRDGDWRGTGLNVPPPGLTVGGKTGTAEFKTDGQKNNLAWFVGYAPADNPKVAVAVLVEGRAPDPSSPGTSIMRPVSGGKVAGAVARQMFEAWQKNTR